MQKCFRKSLVLMVVVLFVVGSAEAQAPAAAYRAPRLNGRPNLNGIWQAVNTANWDLQDHPAQPGPMWQLGSIGAVPAGQGVVEGGEIPYRPDALQKKQQNFAKRQSEDPEAKCYLPGIPRATYLPFPFQIVQSQSDILMVYEFATANRLVNMGPPQKAGSDTWMGTSNGRWEGETLVVDVTGLNGLAWFDRAGNFASDRIHVVERFTRTGPDHMLYEATIEDPAIFTRPWKISMTLYRKVERNAQLLEFKCVPFSEELLYGEFKKKSSN